MPGTSYVDRAKIEAAMRGFNAIFNKTLELKPPKWPEIATLVTSTGSSETYGWLGASPKLEKWLGDRRIEEMRADSQEIPNDDFGVGIEIRQNDIDDDKLGLLGPKAAQLAEAGKAHQDQAVFDLLNNGFVGLDFDQQFFFDTDHQSGEGVVQSNKGTATALSQTTFDAGVAAMMAVKDEKGRSLNIFPTHLVVPSALRSVARSIVIAEVQANGASNTNRGVVELIVAPQLTSPTAYFLLDCSRALRPLIMQIRRPLALVEQDDPGSESMFNRRAKRIGVDWRGNAAYGLWQMAWASPGA